MLQRVRRLLEMIRFSHTLFALPFALLSAVLAWHGKEQGFAWLELAGILLCMVFARSAAMAFNRLADRRLDAVNPRTANRHLPAGLLSPLAVTVFTLVCAAGFVASTYMRGLRLIQAPTTLTAQVDAAIGGKTAVNLPEGKNLVGTFYQPAGVLCDVDALATLDDREFRSGLAEVAKYGLALDAELLETLERDPGPVLAREPAAMQALVARCVAIKAATVAGDEHDAGARLTLNFGHTLGHGLERLDAFEGRSHGEAIAIGMVFAARLAEVRGLAGDGLASRTTRLLSSLGLETDGPLPSIRDILASFRMDKKFRGGVRFVLLRDVGDPVLVDEISEDQVVTVLREMGAPA